MGFLIFIVIFLLMLFIFCHICEFNYHDCFMERIKNGIAADENGCYGLVGGDRNTNYLQYRCIDCPHRKDIYK